MFDEISIYKDLNNSVLKVFVKWYETDFETRNRFLSTDFITTLNFISNNGYTIDDVNEVSFDIPLYALPVVVENSKRFCKNVKVI